MNDFIDQYKNLLILQYYNKPKASAEVALFAGEFKRIFEFFSDFEREFDLDFAYGDRLDLIGKLIGLPRTVDEAVAQEFFSFAGNPNGRTFGEGSMFDIFNDVGFAPTELNDDQYRFFIRAKIAKNITSAVMVSDDRITLQDAIQILFRRRAFVVDNQDMTLSIYIDDTFNREDILLLQAQDLIPKPKGVRYRFIVQHVENGTFGFAENPNARTFGQGRFAQLIF